MRVSETIARLLIRELAGECRDRPLAQCEQAHSALTGPAVRFGVFRGRPAHGWQYFHQLPPR